MDETKVLHETINGKYRIQLERSAVKGCDGFKVEVNADDMDSAKADAQKLYDYAISLTHVEVKSEVPVIK